MDIDEQDIAQFVADRTGLPLDRATRILKLGEPWPFVKAYDDLWRSSISDAKLSGVALETVLNANADLMVMGAHSLSGESSHRHIEQTVDLTGEEEETVVAVQSALEEYFGLVMEQVKQVIRQMPGQTDS